MKSFNNKLCACFTMFLMLACTPAFSTALHDYVADTSDFTYGDTPGNTFSGPGWTATAWHMTSGRWRSEAEVDRPLWEHWVTIIVPQVVTSQNAMMIVSGGSVKSTPPTSVDSTFAAIATATQSVVVKLSQIPNERLKFSDETDPRYIDIGRNEDEIIAYAWEKFRISGDPTWLPRLPMTRAVSRAMDLVQIKQPSITGFVVVGASKRGWTTWTTGIADDRAVAIIPMVIDCMNFEHFYQHTWDIYGFWPEAIGDYTDMGTHTWMHTPQMRAMLDIIDPYENIEDLTMPKYIMASTGDQFFCPDGSTFYFDALKGEKYLRYVPNTDHGIDSVGLTIQDIVAFYQAYLNGTPRPQFSWKKLPDGSLRVQTTTAPTVVKLWQASNPSSRDFRLQTIGASWVSSVLTDQGGGVYVGQVAPPAEGWRAFMIELEFPSGGSNPFHFTTEISVVPDTLPYRTVGGTGSLETLGTGTDELTLIKLKGTRYEMGYWYGKLLANEIAAIAAIIEANLSDAELESALDSMWKSAHFDTTMWENELRGIADGCQDAGHPEITFRLVQKMQMVPDLSELGCGLYALWGPATRNGDLYQLRNLDWTMSSNFQNYPVVAIYEPTDGGCRHATVGFAGLIGAAGGGMNEHGLAVSEIQGHFCDAESLNGIPFPFLLRDALMFDSTLDSALSRMSGATRTNQYHYCVAAPGGPGAPGRLLFTSATRFDQFADETVVDHPCLATDPFHTQLDGAIYWKRHDGGGNQNLYNNILSRYGNIGDAEAIDIAKSDGVAGTLLSIVYNNSRRKLWAAYANGMDPAHNQGYVEVDLPALLGDHDLDAILDAEDPDDDNDGLSDIEEGDGDADSDGTPNRLDLDSDGDGLADAVEGNGDPDEDLTPNYLDDDSDGDGLLDINEGMINPDNDEFPSYLDIDSDNDGMPDQFEAISGFDPYAAEDGLQDADGDGKLNWEEYRDGTDPFVPDEAPQVPAAGLAAFALLAAAIGFAGRKRARGLRS